jgi:putative intracellular protease/amidase
VAVNGRLVTGQNPQSASGVGAAIRERLTQAA